MTVQALPDNIKNIKEPDWFAVDVGYCNKYIYCMTAIDLITIYKQNTLYRQIYKPLMGTNGSRSFFPRLVYSHYVFDVFVSNTHLLDIRFNSGHLQQFRSLDSESLKADRLYLEHVQKLIQKYATC